MLQKKENAEHGKRIGNLRGVMPLPIGSHGGAEEGGIGRKTYGGEGVSHGLIWGEIIQTEGTASIEVLR